MKTERQIRSFLARCNKVRDYGMSKGKCPAERGIKAGCCAECSMPSTLLWILGKPVKGSENAQDSLIENLQEQMKEAPHET